MREADRLTAMLFPKEATETLENIKFFPGTHVASVADLRNEAHKALLFVGKGLGSRRIRFGEERQQVEIGDFLSAG